MNVGGGCGDEVGRKAVVGKFEARRAREDKELVVAPDQSGIGLDSLRMLVGLKAKVGVGLNFRMLA